MLVSFDDLPHFANHVLCDGAFDPLHAGHIAYIQSARALHKGPLLCAVASDDQIREKGREPLLPQASRVVVMEALCDAVYAKDRPTEDVIRQMRPTVYAKGWDWNGKLPAEQTAVLQELGSPAFFAQTPQESSTGHLRAWALKDADQSLDRLETFLHAQTVTPPERFDEAYFKGDWRSDGNAYTLEKRREIEGRHPRLLAETFPLCSMLDVGCGPGYLVEFLRELGVEAGGIDPSPAARAMAVNRWVILGDVSQCPTNMADVAISREVLEHLTIHQLAFMVANLFRVAKRYVYITTRFQDGALFDAATDFETDPTHITLLSQPFLRALCVLNGGTRRRDLESKLDHMGKGRVLVYQVAQ